MTNRWSNRFTAVEKAVNRGLSIEPSLNYDKIHNYDDDGLIIIIWDNPNIYWAINSSQTPFYGTIKSISGLSNQNTIYRHIYFLAINNLFIHGHLVSFSSYELKQPHYYSIEFFHKKGLKI